MDLDVFKSDEHVLIAFSKESTPVGAITDLIAKTKQASAPTLMLIATAQDDKWILKFYGSLNTNTSPDTQAFINELLAQNVQKIIADLEKLDYTSSAGLRVMLATTKLIRVDGGDFRICRPNPEVQELFNITGFSMIFNIFPSLEEAIKNF